MGPWWAGLVVGSVGDVNMCSPLSGAAAFVETVCARFPPLIRTHGGGGGSGEPFALATPSSPPISSHPLQSTQDRAHQLPARRSDIAHSQRPGLETRFSQLTSCRRLHTVGDLVCVLDTLAEPGAAEWEAWVAKHLEPSRTADFHDRPTVQSALHRMAAEVSQEWQAAAGEAATLPTDQRPSTMALIMPRLGWRIPGSSPVVRVRNLPVRWSTRLQLGEVLEQRRQLAEGYMREALGGQPRAHMREERGCLPSRPEAAVEADPLGEWG